MANGPKHFDSEQTAAYSESISSAAGTKSEHKKEPEVKHQCPIFHNIIESTSNINEFLAQFAPTATVPPKCPDRKFTAKLYTGKSRKQNVCNQLVKGLKSMVRKFPEANQLQFHNLEGHTMRHPFAMCDLDDYEVRVDVCATLTPPATPPMARWRNLALVFDVHPRVKDDPMTKSSEVHERNFWRLSWIAHNTMLAQGKLYVFIVGIYGRQARLYRIDRSGGICSPLFNYASQPHILHDFLWRFVHPKFDGCVVLGDDPAVKQGSHADRVRVQELVKQQDPEYTYTAENKKAIRRVTATRNDGTKATYLVYKLLYTESYLFGRATTVWEAFALDSDDKATGTRVVIKEAWRHTSSPSEVRFYDAMREAAEANESGAISLAGIVRLECCSDLGGREAEEPSPGASRPGYRTMRSTFGREVHERDFTRMVFATVGTKLEDFKCTYDMVRACRDAVEGHRQAYLSGVIHRDISRGNVMMERKADGTISGFIHDFDHSFNWKRFLADAGLPAELEVWERYVREEYRRVTQQRKEKPKDEASEVSENTRSFSGSAPSHKTEEPEEKVEPPPSEFHVDAAMQKDQKSKVGTIYFIATEVLSNDEPRDTREARHDLESFYWLLLFLVLRHRPCNFFGGWWGAEQHYQRLFKSEDNWGKREWLSKDTEPIQVMYNRPLTALLKSLRQLCKTNYRSDDHALNARWMTHEDVLRAFDEALQHREQWPAADCAQIRVGHHYGEPEYAKYVSDPTVALTAISRPESGDDLPPAPVEENSDALPRPGSAVTSAVEPQRDPTPVDGDAAAAIASAEEQTSAQEAVPPVHAMETRARAAARERVAQTGAGASEAPPRRNTAARQGRKRGRVEEDDAMDDGPRAPQPAKRPRRMAAAPSGRTRGARQPQRRK